MVPRASAALSLVLLLAAVLVPAPPAAAAGAYDPAFPKEELAERRARFFEQVNDGMGRSCAPAVG